MVTNQAATTGSRGGDKQVKHSIDVFNLNIVTVTEIREILGAGGTVGQELNILSVLMDTGNNSIFLGVVVDLTGVDVISAYRHALHTGARALIVDLGYILVLTVVFSLGPDRGDCQ